MIVATRLVIPVLAVLVSTANISAQAPVEHIFVKDTRKQRALETVSDQKLNLARRLIRDKAYLSASAILEQLYEENDSDVVVINLLLNCYDHLGYAAKTELVARRMIEHQPEHPGYHIRLAEALARQSRPDEARAEYRQCLALTPDSNLNQHQAVLQSMMTNGFEDEALKHIDSLREHTSDKRLFALERGALLEQSRQYSEAAREFFAVLSDSGSTVANAEKKLQALLEYPNTSQEIEQTLLTLMRDSANARAASLLSGFYLKSERFDQAFDYAVIRDSLQNLNGAVLLSYVRDCRERKLYEQVIRMAGYIISHYPENPIAGETYFLYADALVELGRPDQAKAVYDTIYASFPRLEDKAAALYNIANIS
ncbi:MAG: tetratricopeptide repeat protein, partial [Candidatus Zixiibacteriota bacterium]